MIDKYVLATNDDGDLAIRTVSATESSSVTDTTSVITATDDGKLAVRVVGTGGGSDQHNLGWYATQAALEEAHPTAEAGDWAIVGSTDTVWLWDTDNEEWVDSDTKGQVTSVNNQTGAVTLGINDVAPTQTGKSGYVLGTDGFVAGWVKPEIVQVSALPAASEDEVDNIYQFIGTTDANYTNGYFYKCVSDGQDPATYSWTQTDVQPQAGGLPSQTGQSGKFLTTDGTDASWSDKPLVNTATGTNSLQVLGRNGSSNYSVVLGDRSGAWYDYSVAIGNDARGLGQYSVAIGQNSTEAGNYGVAIGFNNQGVQASSISIGNNNVMRSSSSIAIGRYCDCRGNNNIQLGSGTNSDANTFKVGNANGNFEIMSADGTIPTARLTKVNTTITLAAADWSSNTQTVNVTGMTATGVVMVSPDPTDQSAYTSAGVLCTAQAAGTLTFTCDTVPSGDIDVNVVML